MKKIIYITFIFLAVVFCFKSIITYAAASSDSICFVLDIEEGTSEKEDADEKKSDTEDWLFGSSENKLDLNSLYNNPFGLLGETRCYIPYFEINSPPPEFSL